jgi:murein DD-endopeptidase MepM/ murein hydrolase activator NlpD
LLAALIVVVASGCGGVIHHVADGENLYRIGIRYGVPAKEIAKANSISDVKSLRVGQRLYIPGARRRLAASSNEGESSRPGVGASGNPAEARRKARGFARNQTSLNFAWPVRGKLSSKFGSRWGKKHEGIDITARTGTPIFASESGRVVISGRMRGYGKVVVVKHAGKYKTLYAHASRLVVKKGAFVERGQKIAEVGSTGRSTGPHLHFEVLRSDTAQNPMGYLP